ncbi:hypothetical protein SAMN05660297_01700 [Natronincola peptidivorans]|uniref:Uncharacterized protein n=1 Tax=Natronincola peptidivorans TaxID=426128 RepID=A0A1I0CPY9_9FIRM|nr:hypothetical protein [Natronincola peptidivorans]SET21582.1 hypothetical protein SAMN05660297_01700 [Natronincola peptidivorans]
MNMKSMISNKDRFILVVLFCLFLTQPAYAYLDAGTVTIVLQAVVGAIVGLLVAIKLYWHKLKNLFTKKG